MQQFIRFKVFDRQENDLFSLTTKDVASEDVREALFTAEDRGKELVDTFVKERLASDSQNFYEPIKKNQIKQIPDVSFHVPYINFFISKGKES